jgi:hypothetical protein
MVDLTDPSEVLYGEPAAIPAPVHELVDRLGLTRSVGVRDHPHAAGVMGDLRPVGRRADDAAHAATAARLGVRSMITIDTGFAAVSASELELYALDRSRVDAVCGQVAADAPSRRFDRLPNPDSFRGVHTCHEFS